LAELEQIGSHIPIQYIVMKKKKKIQIRSDSVGGQCAR